MRSVSLTTGLAVKRETAKQIHESSYCDDVILTTDKEEDLIPMTQAMIDMLQEAGLPVGKFYSNNYGATFSRQV